MTDQADDYEKRASEAAWPLPQHRPDAAKPSYVLNEAKHGRTALAYGYVNNSPVNHTDPTGLFVWTLPALAMLAEYYGVTWGLSAAAGIVAGTAASQQGTQAGVVDADDLPAAPAVQTAGPAVAVVALTATARSTQRSRSAWTG